MNILLLLSASFVVLIVVIAWYRPGTSNRRAYILTLLTIIPLVYALHWLGLKMVEGWPTDEALPNRFELLDANIVEPNELKGIEGNIFLWIRTTQYSPPRSYMLPYTRSLHEKLSDAGKRKARGKKQVGSTGEGKVDRLQAIVSGGKHGKSLSFEDAPPTQLPTKK